MQMTQTPMTSSTGLKYQIHGRGEPVLLIHGAHIADTYRPLVAEPLFASYRKITHRRRGYADSPSRIGPFSIEDAAGDALRLLKDLGIERAHVVGHSSGSSRCKWRCRHRMRFTRWSCWSPRS